jgi:CheY-like chemotaxis protein
MTRANLNILIVEDNKINQLLVKNMLLKFGFSNLDLAQNGKTAFKKLSENNYDIILLDIQMPGMNGYEITNEIRTKKSLRHHRVPIIALTGNGSEKDMVRGKEAGINDYVIKPHTPEALCSAILKYAIDNNNKPVHAGESKKTHAGKKIAEKNKKTEMDLSFLEKYTGGDLALTTQLIEIFLREVPSAIEKLDKFIMEKKWKEVHAVAHKVKSSFAIFELTALRKISLEIEECAGKLVRLESLPKLLDEFSSAYQKILPDVEAELKKIKVSPHL